MSDNYQKPPRIGSWILQHILPYRDSLYLYGDFKEIYFGLLEENGPVRAWFWFWLQVIKVIPQFLQVKLIWSYLMLKSNIKLFLRTVSKNKAYSIINISGLSIGLFAFILMLLYVQDELSYDRFHKKAENIYRLGRDLHYSENVGLHATSAGPFAPNLLTDFPEIVQGAVRFLNYSAVVSVNNEDGIQEDRLFLVEPQVFDLFDYELEQGDEATALTDPFTIILTPEMAEKYFRGENPIGKTLRLENQYDFKVTGVFKKIPRNTHLKFDFLASWSTVKQIFSQDLDTSNYSNVWYPLMYTYLYIPDKTRILEFEEKLPDFIVKMYGTWARTDISFIVQPILDIHLHSKLESELEANSDIVYVYIISAVALLVLLIACINFMNLSTSRSAKRAKEVGVRKVLGAYKKQLIRQFLSESIGYSMLSLATAVGLAALLMPAFNAFTGKELSLNLAQNLDMLLWFASLILLVGIISGSYPAFFLSSFRPVRVLKSATDVKSGNSLLRKVLITFQFAITVVLIIGTLVISDQMSYVRNKNLGMNKDQIVVIPIRDIANFANYGAHKEQFLSMPGVISISQTSQLPFKDKMEDIVYGFPNTPQADYPTMYMVNVDHDFLKTMEIEIIDGRDFSKEYGTDLMYGYILNESAVKKLDLKNPVGTDFGRAPKVYGFAGVQRLGKIIGVAKDFHFNSLHSKIEPMAMYVGPHRRNPYGYILVKVSSQNLTNTIETIKAKWQELIPTRPFEFTFLDDNFQQLYDYEDKLGQTFNYFAFFAIFVACLGLFGLVTFTVEQRAKEIGIRKVLGASVPNVINLISKEFVKLVIVSNMIAWPVAFIASRAWLEQFAYRTDITIMFFFLSAFIALVLAVITVSYQTIKAAFTNPVDSIQYE